MAPFIGQINDVLLRDPARGCWLLFREPLQILTANSIEEVIPVFNQLEEAVDGQGVYAAGYVAYEAGAGFDPALQAKPIRSFPLVWFGLYKRTELLPSSSLPQVTGMPAPSYAWNPSIDRDHYDAAIGKIKDCIARGDTYQVNYTYRLVSSFTGDPLETFIGLYRAQNAPYAAFINTERYSICSASPELFFTLEGDLITSRPMKGTASRGLTWSEDLDLAYWLRHSEKNQAENVMIVDMVRNDIGRIARTGSVQVPELYCVEKYPTVWQMVSTVTGETQAGWTGIFKAMFPPASITGAPKARTMEIIAGLETTPRRVYTGSIGYISPGRKAQFNVAIRTLLVDKLESTAEYGVGGGITWDSVDAAEYEECQAKAKILTVRTPRFSLLETFLWTAEEGYFLFDLHLDRLMNSAGYFSFSVELPAVRRHLESLPAAFGSEAQKVRLLIDEAGNITSQAAPLELKAVGKPLRACIASTPVDPADPFLYHKTTHRRIYEQVRASCPEDGGDPWDDVILWNEKGEITESTIANVVVELDGCLYTPPVSCGLLPGAYRAWMLEQGRVKEMVIRLEELQTNPPVYLVNSVRKIQAARIELPEWLVKGR